MQITTSWHEKGKVEGKIEAIYKFMMRRFGAKRYATGTVPSSSLRPFATLRGRSNRPMAPLTIKLRCSISRQGFMVFNITNVFLANARSYR